jgi:uncharacterized protein YcfL
MNTNRHLLKTAAAVLLFLAGCAGKEPPPTSQIIEHQENLKTEPNRARIVEPGAKVVGKANDIKVSEIRTQTINGRITVDFLLTNDRGRRDVINYRVRWLDQNGLTVSQYDPWETVALEGHEQSVLSVTAPVATATDFRLELKTNQ